MMLPKNTTKSAIRKKIRMIKYGNRYNDTHYYYSLTNGVDYSFEEMLDNLKPLATPLNIHAIENEIKFIKSLTKEQIDKIVKIDESKVDCAVKDPRIYYFKDYLESKILIDKIILGKKGELELL